LAAAGRGALICHNVAPQQMPIIGSNADPLDIDSECHESRTATTRSPAATRAGTP
jgi:hypothetical protein